MNLWRKLFRNKEIDRRIAELYDDMLRSHQHWDLYDAVDGGNCETLRALLKGRPNIEANGKNAILLPLAVAKGRDDMVELLLVCNADATRRDDKGWTQLHFAASTNNRRVVEVLLNYGADINAKNNAGETPLHIAAFLGVGKDVVELLLSRGADPHMRDNAGRTPLQVSEMGKELDISGEVTELLRNCSGRR